MNIIEDNMFIFKVITGFIGKKKSKLQTIIADMFENYKKLGGIMSLMLIFSTHILTTFLQTLTI